MTPPESPALCRKEKTMLVGGREGDSFGSGAKAKDRRAEVTLERQTGHRLGAFCLAIQRAKSLDR